MSEQFDARRQIQNALLELMLEKDIYHIRVTELASKSGVARSTFYLYYGSVHDVLQEIEDNYFEEIDRLSERSQSPGSIFDTDINDIICYAPVIKALLGPYGSMHFRAKRELSIQKRIRIDAPEQLLNNPLYLQLETILIGSRINLDYYVALHHDDANIEAMKQLIRYQHYQLNCALQAMIHGEALDELIDKD